MMLYHKSVRLMNIRKIDHFIWPSCVAVVYKYILEVKVKCIYTCISLYDLGTPFSFQILKFFISKKSQRTSFKKKKALISQGWNLILKYKVCRKLRFNYPRGLSLTVFRQLYNLNTHLHV